MIKYLKPWFIDMIKNMKNWSSQEGENTKNKKYWTQND